MPDQPSPDANLTLERMSERLAQGESAQAMLEELVNLTYPHSMTPTRLQFLFGHNVKIATGEPGCALGKLIEQAPGIMDELIASKVMKSMMATPGEIPLHILARDRPDCLKTILDETAGGPTPDALASLRRTDAHGRTPSHWLWADGSLLVNRAILARHAQGGDQVKEEVMTKLWVQVMRIAWRVQERLQDLGIGMDVPDHEGVTALALCHARLQATDAVLFPGQAICRQVKAYQDAQALSENTPHVPPAAAAIRF